MENNVTESASLYAGLIDDAKEAVKQREDAQSDRDGAPLIFPDNGMTILRFYLEKYTVENQERLRVIRKIYRHKFDVPKQKGNGTYVLRVLCEGENCRVCEQVQRLRDIQYGQVWKHACGMEGVASAVIYKNPQENDRVKLGEPTAMVLDYRIVNAFERWLMEMSPEDAEKMLNPETEQMGIQLTWVRESNGMSAGFGFAPGTHTLPKLPPEWPSLDKVWIGTDRIATDEDMNNIKASVSKIVAHKMNIQDPTQTDGDLMGGMTDAQPTSQALAAAAPTSDMPAATSPTEVTKPVTETPTPAEPAPAPVAEAPQAQTPTPVTEGEKCAGILNSHDNYGLIEGKFHFGAHPPDMQPTCILCDHQEACKGVTQG